MVDLASNLSAFFNTDSLSQTIETKVWVDENKNPIHYLDSTGEEWWKEYDERGNVIHFRRSEGEEYDDYEEWYEYNSSDQLTYFRSSYGFEEWREYDENGQIIDIMRLFNSEPYGIDKLRG